MPPVVKGTILPARQSRTWTYDPTSGDVYKEELAGFGFSAIAAIREAYRNAGVATELHSDGGKFVLVVNDTRSASNIDTWQICQNELQIPATKNPRHNDSSHPVVGAVPISQDDLDAIAAAIGGTGTKNYDELRAEFISRPSSSMTDSAIRLLDRMNRGETHYSESGYVLRHTTNCGANAEGYNAADLNIGFIYTNSQLIAECQDSTLWTFPMPARLAAKITALSAPAEQTAYRWGWLKRASTETTAANNRVEISTEFWLAQWSLSEYYAL